MDMNKYKARNRQARNKLPYVDKMSRKKLMNALDRIGYPVNRAGGLTMTFRAILGSSGLMDRNRFEAVIDK